MRARKPHRTSIKPIDWLVEVQAIIRALPPVSHKARVEGLEKFPMSGNVSSRSIPAFLLPNIELIQMELGVLTMLGPWGASVSANLQRHTFWVSPSNQPGPTEPPCAIDVGKVNPVLRLVRKCGRAVVRCDK